MNRYLVPVLVALVVVAGAGVVLVLGSDDKAGEELGVVEETTTTAPDLGFETVCWAGDDAERRYLPCTDVNCSGQANITCLDLPKAQVVADCIETAGYWDCTTTTTTPVPEGFEYLSVADLDQSGEEFCADYMRYVPNGYCQVSPDGLSVWFAELPDRPTETVPTDFDGDGVIEEGEFCVRYTDTGEEFCGE